LIEEALMVAQGAGELLKKRFLGFMGGDALKVEEKGPSDFVTRVDREVEDWILKQLEVITPGVPVLSEEHFHGQEISPTCWIVDPLDGTRSFIHGIPHFGVTLAFMEEGRLVLGVTYAPMEDEIFHAEAGKGMWFNGRRVTVSSVEEPSKAAVAMGLPFRGREHLDALLAFYRAMYTKGVALRHTGSAALDLCYVACGRYDGLFYLDLSPWDVAAGGLMVQEAGGVVEGLAERPWLEGWILASNARFYPFLEAVAQEALRHLDSLGGRA